MRRASLIMIIVATLTVTSFLYVRGQAQRATAQTTEATSRTTTPKKSLKRVQVTAQTIANLPAGKPRVIDLTRTGTIYSLAAGIDCSRVRVRTLTGEKAMCSLVKQLGTKGELLLGNDRIEDLYSHVGRFSPARISGTQQFTCTDSGACKCKGYIDCLAMQAVHPRCQVVIIDQETGYTYCVGPLGP